MRYYLRHSPSAPVEGPFTVDALADGIRVGRISQDSLASSDLGEEPGRLQTWRRCDWFPLAAIAELRDVLPPPVEGTSGPSGLSGFGLFGFGLMVASMGYRAITEGQWWAWVGFVCGLFAWVSMISQYVRPRWARRSVS